MKPIEKTNKYARLQDMLRFIKKWWLLQWLDKLTNQHTQGYSEEEIAKGQYIGLTQVFFVEELAKKASRRFWIPLIWRRFDSMKNNTERRKKKMRIYHSLVKECIDGESKYIENNTGIHASGEERVGIIVSPKGYEIHGYFGLLEHLLKNYKLSWTFIIIPLLTGILGTSYFISIINLVRDKINF